VSFLLATFDVLPLLLKELRKFAAPVRRRNQNILHSRFGELFTNILSKEKLFPCTNLDPWTFSFFFVSQKVSSDMPKSELSFTEL
jgi:hypothetical protein